MHVRETTSLSCNPGGHFDGELVKYGLQCRSAKDCAFDEDCLDFVDEDYQGHLRTIIRDCGYRGYYTYRANGGYMTNATC